MYTQYSCGRCSLMLPIAQYSFECPICSTEDQSNLEISSTLKNPFIQEDMNSFFPVCSGPQTKCRLNLVPDSKENSLPNPNSHRKRKEISWSSARRNNRTSRLISQVNKAKDPCIRRLPQTKGICRMPPVHTTLVVDAEERPITDTNTDEGFYDFSDTENERDTIWAQFEALMVGYGLPLAQIAGESSRARKSRNTSRWRRSAECIYEGKPMVRNQIRMRKASARSSG